MASSQPRISRSSHDHKPNWYVFLLLLFNEVILAHLHTTDILDSDLLQPGRIYCKIEFPLPGP